MKGFYDWKWYRISIRTLFAWQFLLALGLISWKYFTRPIGLDGFCPVTLRQQAQWLKGDSECTATFEGISYQFAGDFERELFLENPNQYAPVLGGCDIVRYVEDGIRVTGSRRYGFWYREKVYLFENNKSFSKFQEDFHTYASALTN